MSQVLFPNVDDRAAFLDLLPQAERSTMANVILTAIRSCLRSEAEVFAAVADDVAHRLQENERYVRNGWGDDGEKLRRWRSLLTDRSAEVLRCIRYYLAYEALPASERQRIKDGNTEVYRRGWMASQPASPAQRGFLRRLGWTGTEPLNKQEASELIERLKAGGNG